MGKIPYLLFFLFSSAVVIAQNTVGLLSYNPAKSYEGYNLIYPHNQATVFLLDNCGEIVHQWEDDASFRPGNVAYILENGNLFKTKRLFSSAVNDPIWAGGGGETVELRTWENELLASITINNEDFRLHHDIAPLPNGNVLMIVWERRTGAEAFAAGRDTSQLSQGEMWPDVIWEWNPMSNAIVWQWRAWDHLIQNFNPSVANFGVVSEHPELININYDEVDGHPDWLHLNAIDYNPVLDQIILSNPHFNEIWIIDHSTTTEEAAGHTGGRSGKGGDLLYRWGNPAVYDQGSIRDKQLFFQHDVKWINSTAEQGDKNFGRISLFNNRIGETLSTGNIIDTGVDPITGSYEMKSGRFAPDDFEGVFSHPEAPGNIFAFSTSLSSFQVLPNDNVLFCAGRRGYSYEINEENKVIWEYFTPIKNGSRVVQGDTSFNINNNLTFRTDRYELDYAAFQGRDLAPKGFIEFEPNEDFCGTLSVSTSTLSSEEYTISVSPNPTTHTLNIHKSTNRAILIFLYDNLGRVVWNTNFVGNNIVVPVENLPSGIYFLGDGTRVLEKVIIHK